MTPEISPRATLTPKRIAFAEAFVELGNASAAYRRAYSVARMSPASINNEAHRLLRVPGIAAYVAGLQAAASRRNEITQDWLIERLKENLARFTQAEPVLDSDGKATGEYRLYAAAANRAIELIARITGHMAPVRVEHSGPDGGPMQHDVAVIEAIVANPRAASIHTELLRVAAAEPDGGAEDG